MIGIDTNILVRYITQDDDAQSPRVAVFLDSLTPEQPGFITLIVLAEFYWVLNRRYQRTKAQFAQAMQWLLESPEIILQDELLVREALAIFQQTNADFADCLIAKCALAAGCESFVTFDRKAARALGLQLLF